MRELLLYGSAITVTELKRGSTKKLRKISESYLRNDGNCCVDNCRYAARYVGKNKAKGTLVALCNQHKIWAENP